MSDETGGRGISASEAALWGMVAYLSMSAAGITLNADLLRAYLVIALLCTALVQVVERSGRLWVLAAVPLSALSVVAGVTYALSDEIELSASMVLVGIGWIVGTLGWVPTSCGLPLTVRALYVYWLLVLGTSVQLDLLGERSMATALLLVGAVVISSVTLIRRAQIRI